MKITREAYAGTLESSDVMIRIAPGNGNISIDISSIVLAQFGDAIRDAINATLADLKVTDAAVIADDKGALDCVIRARVQAAVARASDDTLALWGAA